MRFSDYEMEKGGLGLYDCRPVCYSEHRPGGKRLTSPYLSTEKLFRKIIEISGRGTQLDVITLNAETGNKDPAYVASITDTVPSGANFGFYCEKVKRYQ